MHSIGTKIEYYYYYYFKNCILLSQKNGCECM